MENQVRISDSTINYGIVHRNIKYPRLEFKTGKLLLVLPKGHNDYGDLIEKYKGWIFKRSSEIAAALEQAQKKKLDLERTDEELKQMIGCIVENISSDLKINLNNIYFRSMKSKWGSCSPNKNLMINTLLKYLPDNLIEYVIFHEMIHLKERKHNEHFWKIISTKFDNYEEKETELFEYWFLFQKVVNSSHERS